MQKWSRLGAVVALSAGLLTMVSAPAMAEEPVELGGAYILDTAGVVSGDEQRIIDSLDSLYDRARIQLFVVYVSTFDSPSDPAEWADETAIRNGLGVDDLPRVRLTRVCGHDDQCAAIPPADEAQPAAGRRPGTQPPFIRQISERLSR